MNKADKALLKPGVRIGRHPSTGVIHRLTIRGDGKMEIERTPYVSPLDGWTQTYEKLIEEAEKHLFLILTITQNACEWP